MLSLLTRFFSFLYFYIRPSLKWFLRRTTRLCELQRICYGEEFGYSRTNKIDESLNLSRTKEIQNMVKQLNELANHGRFVTGPMLHSVEYAMQITLRAKNIKPDVHKPFLNGYEISLFQIYGYKQLLYEVERLRKMSYSSDDVDHEEKLLKLWTLLNPDKPLLSRVSKQWADIGFQGDDPKTDFRGMGLLGLENLLYFATEYNKIARHVLLHSNHPNYGYSFAIVGINLTSMAYHMLKDHRLKVHFYNSIKGRPNIQHFHYIYSYLFYSFDKFWLAEKPRDIMEFSRIRAKFEASIVKQLEDPKTKLKLSYLIEEL